MQNRTDERVGRPLRWRPSKRGPLPWIRRRPSTELRTRHGGAIGRAPADYGWHRHEVERIARRIHGAGPRAAGPFVPVRVRAWPTTARTIRKRWAAVFDATTGGSIFLTDVEDMSPEFQNVFVEMIDDLQRAKTPSTAARLISGTTVSLMIASRPAHSPSACSIG